LKIYLMVIHFLENVIFRDNVMRTELKTYVECGLPNVCSKLRAAGIPPHVSILNDLKSISSTLEENMARQDDNVSRIIAGVVRELEIRAIGAGTVTRDGLKESLMECLEEAGVMRVVRGIESPSVAESIPSVNSTVAQRFPIDVKLPVGSVSIAWQYWCCGNASQFYPPLSNLKPSDIQDSKVRKRLSDYRFLMSKIQRRAVELNIWVENDITIAECLAIFELDRNSRNNTHKPKAA
jgi:hypothetical protein